MRIAQQVPCVRRCPLCRHLHLSWGSPSGGLEGWGCHPSGGVREEGRATVPPLGSQLFQLLQVLYFLVFCFYGSKMLEETRESVLSLTLGEVSTGKKPERTKNRWSPRGGGISDSGTPCGGWKVGNSQTGMHADFPESMLGVMGRG